MKENSRVAINRETKNSLTAVYPTLIACGFMLLFHFPIPLPLSNGLFLPYAVLPFVALGMLIYRPDARVLLKIVASSILFVFLVQALSSFQTISFTKRLLSGGQLIYIMAFCALIVGARPLLREERGRYAAAFIIVSMLICGLGLLEIFTPLRNISDAARDKLYPGNLLYTSEGRDMVLAGRLRPNVFASEPSQAAWSVCIFVLCYLAFSRRTMDFLIAFMVLLAATMIFVSPSTVAILMLVLVLYVFERLRTGYTSKLVHLMWLMPLSVSLATGIAYIFFANRYMHASELDRSTYLRLVQPFDLVAAALKENALIGVGFAGLESIWTQMSYIETKAIGDNFNANVGMALLTIPTFTGLIGLMAFLMLCVYAVRVMRGWAAAQVLAVLFVTMLQKQSFVITSAWVVAAIWVWSQKGLPTECAGRDTRYNRSDLRS